MSLLRTADQILEAARTAIEDSDNLGVPGIYGALPTSGFRVDTSADLNGRYVAITLGVDIIACD